MAVLTICIPTYNRFPFLISQLEFLNREIMPFRHFFDIIVCDNCSSIENREQLINYHKLNNFFRLELNSTNIGSIGNIYKLLSFVETKYVWFLSDDDILLEGILSNIMNILFKHDNLYHLYLNYGAFSQNPDKIDFTPDMLGYSGFYTYGRDKLIELLIKNGTMSMFITSCIYLTNPLKNFCSKRSNPTLIDPLLFSFILGQGSIYIENTLYVLERCTVPSWHKEWTAIFSWQVQLGLIELLDYSYSKSDIARMIYSMYISNKGNYLRMLIYLDTRRKFDICFLLGFRNLILFCTSFYYNISRVLSRLRNFLKLFFTF